MRRAQFFLALLGCLVAVGAGAADETWKQPLDVKEAAIEEGILLKHNILGLYPSMVQIPPHGAPGDLTTTNPFADIQHAVCWTANYLAGLSYKYAVLKASGAPQEEIDAARARADEVFEAVYRCQRVTGVRGLQARGYFFGHGETYAERENSNKLPFWRQGEADGQAFRWVGDPSHHNYSDSIHGLGQYYNLAAEGEQKERARECIDALVGYWVDNDLNISKYDKSLRQVPILGMTDGKRLNTRVFMAIAGAKIAHDATGKEKYKAVYERLLEQYGVREMEEFKAGKGFDDAEHVFSHLGLLFRIEQDPKLLAAFRKVADGMWKHYIDDGQSLFTYIYYGIAPDAPGKEKALQDALFTLQTFPTDMTVKPQRNSMNPDLKPPYPTYLAAWDNEYIWKGNLLRPDGWQCRAVVDVAVSPEDPMVIYAVGVAGGLYQSRDGAAKWDNWKPIDQALLVPVRAVDVGRRTRILAVACSDGFHLSTTAGEHWKRLPVPADGGRPVDILFDPDNTNLIYATTSKGVYRSRDFGEEFLGEMWETLTEGLPPLGSPSFTVALGEPGRLYAVSANRLFTRTLDDPEWTRGTDYGLGEYATTYPWLAVDPTDPDRVVAGIMSKYGGMGTMSFLQESTDAGQTWSNDFEAIFTALSKGGFAAVGALAIPHELNGLVMDRENPQTLYVSAARGILKSTDGGKTWQAHETGMHIPLVNRLSKPQHSEWLFASTPGGLYISKDGGATWGDGNLWLQFEKNTRRELGGAAYIDAYWRGRYYKFIDEATARAPYTGD